MKKALVLGAALLMFAGVASAQYNVELDLDATLGNGPDFLATAPGPVAVDVWITGGAGLNVLSANLTLSHTGPGSWVGYAYDAATGGVGGTPPADQGGGTAWLVQWTDFNFVGLLPPFIHGVASYNYNGPTGLVNVTVIQPQGWFDGAFLSGPFTGNTDASFGTVVTATEETSWGAVKDLFR